MFINKLLIQKQGKNLIIIDYIFLTFLEVMQKNIIEEFEDIGKLKTHYIGLKMLFIKKTIIVTKEIMRQ